MDEPRQQVAASSVSSRVLFLLLRLLLPVLLHLACVCDARDEHFFIFRDGLADERALYRNLVVARLRPSLQKIPRYTPITITSHVGDACRPFLRRLRSAERTPPRRLNQSRSCRAADEVEKSEKEGKRKPVVVQWSVSAEFPPRNRGVVLFLDSIGHVTRFRAIPTPSILVSFSGFFFPLLYSARSAKYQILLMT